MDSSPDFALECSHRTKISCLSAIPNMILSCTVLKQASGSAFDTDAIIQNIAKRPAIDYRVETLFEMLDEYVYEARLANKPIHDRGFIVTRSWEPSLTFEIPYDNSYRCISVPFSMCACSKGERPDPGALVQQSDYNHDSNREFSR